MKIFTKLFLLLLGLSVVPLLVVGGVVLWRSGALRIELLARNREAGDTTARASQQALYDEARRAYLLLVESRANKLEEFFENGRRVVELQTALVRAAMAEPPAGGGPPVWTSPEMQERMADPSFARQKAGKTPYVVYQALRGVDAAKAAESARRLGRLAEFYAYTAKNLPWFNSIYFGSADGFIAGYPAFQPIPDTYDPRERPWYRKAVDKGRLTWTEMYVGKDGGAVMTAAEPVFDGGRLLGVSALDVAMTDFLGHLFDAGKLSASGAVLANYLGQVRIAANYGGRAQLESWPPEDAPTVERYGGGVFAAAFKRAAEGKSGILALDAAGRPAAGDAPAADGELYAFAPVTLRTREGGKQWYYIVRAPIRGIIQPAIAIRRRLDDVHLLLSQSISSDLWALGVQIWIILSAVAALTLAIAYFSAHSVTEPLRHIAEVVKRIGRGDLDQRVDLALKDEIGDVGRAINDMAKGLKEGLFVKETFKRYVAASVVDQLIQEPGRLKLGGERKELTVFFSDVSGFTSLSENLTPERLVELINLYLSEMTEGILRYEGTLDKYEGDAIVAFWGAPIDQPDHALRACKAALDNVAALKILRKHWVEEGLPPLDIRIGLNTGPMVVGNMGSTIKMDYTVMGDAVNLGSRLEGANKPYGTHIMISEATRRAVGDAVVARELDLLAVKGKTTAVRVFELIGMRGKVPARALEGYHFFETGLEACRERDWEAALAAFRSADALLEGDRPSRLFIERVSRFVEAPPPADWDGRFVLTEK